MAMQSLTPENAPRDSAELLKVGRFMMRTLARNLPIAKDAAKHAEFLRLKDEEMAAELARILKEMDGATKKAAPAAADKKTGKTRQPPAAEAEQETTEDAKPAASKAPVGAAVDPKVAKDVIEILALTKSNTKEIESLHEKIDATFKMLARVAAVQLTIAAQATGAPEEELLGVAAEDAKRLFDVPEGS